MTITDLSHLVTDFGLDLQRMQATDRSKGVHLSAILTRIARIEAGRKFKEQGPITQEMMEQWEKGHVWELMFSEFWRRRVGTLQHDWLIPQYETTRDGIFLTPDFIDTRDDSVLECKATTRSVNKLAVPEEHFRSWVLQMMAYCHAMRTTRARLAALFLCGDYKPPFPTVRLLQFDFHKQDLESNWRNILEQRDALLSEGY